MKKSDLLAGNVLPVIYQTLRNYASIWQLDDSSLSSLEGAVPGRASRTPWAYEVPHREYPESE